MSILKEMMAEYMKEHPNATSMEVTRHVYEKRGKPCPSFPISGQYFKQVKEELGILGRLSIRKKKKKPKEILKTERVEVVLEKRGYKKKKNRLYYTIWECSLEGVTNLTDKLKDFIETLNSIRGTKFEMLEIANPRKIEIRESN